MDSNFEERIVSEYNSFFPGLYEKSPSQAWGLHFEDGWVELFSNLCRNIREADTNNFTFVQVKEKFGGLRIYFLGGNEKICQLIKEAEDASLEICEFCGSRQNVTRGGIWVKTLCGNCRK